MRGVSDLLIRQSIFLVEAVNRELAVVPMPRWSDISLSSLFPSFLVFVQYIRLAMSYFRENSIDARSGTCSPSMYNLNNGGMRGFD